MKVTLVRFSKELPVKDTNVALLSPLPCHCVPVYLKLSVICLIVFPPLQVLKDYCPRVAPHHCVPSVVGGLSSVSVGRVLIVCLLPS